MTIYANNVAGTLAASIGPSDTLVLLGAGQGAVFPSTFPFYVTLVHSSTGAVEIVQVTARSVDTLTVVRGRDSTTAIAFTVGSVAEMRLCAVMLRELDYSVVRGAANGLASLDAAGLILLAQLPLTIATHAELDAVAAAQQNVLGFTPVQQGTGVGQLSNTIKIGWDGAKVLITVDTAAQGAFALEPWVNTALSAYIPLTQRGAANGVATLGAGALIPTAQIPALPYLPTANPSSTGNFSSAGNVTAAGTVVSYQNFTTSVAAVVLAPGSAGPVYLRPNGAGSATGEAVLGTDGVLVVTNTQATSDKRLKKLITRLAADAFLADKLEFSQWVWKADNTPGFGIIAQAVGKVAPRYVGGDKVLSIDKASLAIEAVIGLAARVRQLEKGKAK